jgi:hypothetical protein
MRTMTNRGWPDAWYTPAGHRRRAHWDVWCPSLTLLATTTVAWNLNMKTYLTVVAVGLGRSGYVEGGWTTRSGDQGKICW